MLKRMLVPLDGSDISEIVYPWLRLLASESDDRTSKILLLRVFEPPSRIYLLPGLSLPSTNPLSDEFFASKIKKYLKEQESKLPELDVSSLMVTGEPASEILARADDHDLIVMSSHGRGGIGRWLIGSVANKVSRAAETPLFMVGARSRREAYIGKILVPVDGSETAERAFKTANTWARIFGAKLCLYQGVGEAKADKHLTLTESYLKNLALSTDSQNVDWEVRETRGRVGIASYAEEIGADLIIMGSHGKGGAERWLLGSQAERTLQHAPCPVLITH